jgi:hypothetical protein
MAFKPFKVLTSILSSLTRPNTVLKGPTIPNFKTVASKKGIIDYNPTNADYSNPYHSGSGKFFVYPIDVKDQEHYILFDIIERTGESGNQRQVTNRQITKRADNLDTVVYGANRFFSEGTTSGIMGIPTGKGAARTIKNSIAIYMPQTLKFNLAADYGAADIGGALGAFAKIKDAINSGSGFTGPDMGAVAQQAGKLATGLSSFFTGGLGEGIGAAVQRRTGIAPAAMSEMIFNGIDYRTFSFTFKFTPRSKKESDVVNNLLHEIKESMLPLKYGTGSIAAYKVPHEFTIRFMRGTQVNPFIDQIGLCACTGVDIDYGGDKFSTHPSGDPVSIDATLTFKELELMERSRYNQLRQSATSNQGGPPR